MDRIFIGYDKRQPVTYNVLQQSIVAQASRPLSITPMHIEQLPMAREGWSPFSYSRFLVPYLCGFKGWAAFMDCDMLMNGDIAELFDLADDKYAVMVSKNEDRIKWSSMMLFNCGHRKNKVLTPKYLEGASRIHEMNWIPDKLIGAVPRAWNHIVGYDVENPDAKLIHYTQGVPLYQETVGCEHSTLWHGFHRMLNFTKPWVELMGDSGHSVQCEHRRLPKFMFDEKTKRPKPEYAARVNQLLDQK